jgi:hypothetical protein
MACDERIASAGHRSPDHLSLAQRSELSAGNIRGSGVLHNKVL